MSVEATVATTEFMGDSLTFIDCPGSIEFSFEAEPVLAACDVAVVVAEADEKKIPALQLIMRKLDDLGVPRILFLNKIDKGAAGVRDTLKLLQPASSAPLLLRQIPLRKEGIVIGSIDLALERAYIYREYAESEIAEIPSDEKAREIEARFSMLETLADHDDQLMEQLLDEIEPPKDAVFDDLAADLREGMVTPVLIGTAEKGNGVLRLLKAIRHDAPDVAANTQAARPGRTGNNTVVQVMKTIHTPHGGKLSISRILSGIGRRRDGTFRLRRRHREGVRHLPHARKGSGEACIREGGRNSRARQAGRGQDRQHAEFGQGRHSGAGRHRCSPTGLRAGAALQGAQGRCQALRCHPSHRGGGSLAACRPPPGFQRNGHLGSWRDASARHRRAARRQEPDSGRVSRAGGALSGNHQEIDDRSAGRHKKQSGGHGQFGDVVLDIKPLPRGTGFQFTDTITGGVVPKQYIPSVEAGVRDYLKSGPLGFPVIDVAVNLADGSYHSVDSSDMAFQMAAKLAMKEGMASCSPVLLEPVMKVEIYTPNDATAKITAIVPQRRGQILGYDARPGWPGWDVVEATMPQSAIGDLIIELRSATAGVASYSARFDHMAELTGRLADEAMNASGKAA